ncbi:MAG: fused DSP-PTPase phosphatase/NAD kinase-like protein [Phycisphaerae bacterium]
MSVVRRSRTRVMLAALLVLAIGGVGGAWVWHEYVSFPKRFGVVHEGRLYRSGEVTPGQLERVAQQRGVKTVLSLLDPAAPESIAERAAAERLGIRWLNVPLTGDGASKPEDREKMRTILLDEANAPLLVHCAAGANRTGLACGMVRLHRDGWTIEQVLDEMRRYSFDDLPKHENLRAALREEAELAEQRRR